MPLSERDVLLLTYAYLVVNFGEYSFQVQEFTEASSQQESNLKTLFQEAEQQLHKLEEKYGT